MSDATMASSDLTATISEEEAQVPSQSLRASSSAPPSATMAPAAMLTSDLEDAGPMGPPGETGPPGPEGPQGPPGPPGVLENAGYVHYQTSPAMVWTVIHPLTFQPNVTVVDSIKREIYPGEVEYLTASTIRLTFSASVGGEAYLS